MKQSKDLLIRENEELKTDNQQLQRQVKIKEDVVKSVAKLSVEDFIIVIIRKVLYNLRQSNCVTGDAMHDIIRKTRRMKKAMARLKRKLT